MRAGLKARLKSGLAHAAAGAVARAVSSAMKAARARRRRPSPARVRRRWPRRSCHWPAPRTTPAWALRASQRPAGTGRRGGSPRQRRRRQPGRHLFAWPVAGGELERTEQRGARHGAFQAAQLGPVGRQAGGGQPLMEHPAVDGPGRVQDGLAPQRDAAHGVGHHGAHGRPRLLVGVGAGHRPRCSARRPRRRARCSRCVRPPARARRGAVGASAPGSRQTRGPRAATSGPPRAATSAAAAPRSRWSANPRSWRCRRTATRRRASSPVRPGRRAKASSVGAGQRRSSSQARWRASSARGWPASSETPPEAARAPARMASRSTGRRDEPQGAGGELGGAEHLHEPVDRRTGDVGHAPATRRGRRGPEGATRQDGRVGRRRDDRDRGEGVTTFGGADRVDDGAGERVVAGGIRQGHHRRMLRPRCCSIEGPPARQTQRVAPLPGGCAPPRARGGRGAGPQIRAGSAGPGAPCTVVHGGVDGARPAVVGPHGLGDVGGEALRLRPRHRRVRPSSTSSPPACRRTSTDVVVPSEP